MKKHALAVAVLSFALGWLFFQSTERERKESGARTASARASTRMASTSRPAPEALERVQELRAKALTDADLPRSLQGSQIPDVTRDSSGELVIDVRLRRLFDYFLSALGERPRAELRALIARHLHARLSETSAKLACDILDDYLELEQARAARGERGSVRDADELRARLSEEHTLRRKYLSEDVADAFFASDERRDQLALARLRARSDGLSASEVEARVATLMTPEERAAREQTFVLTRLRDARQAGEDQAFLNTLEPDARARLEELQERQADFQARRAEYERACAALDHPSREQLWRTAQRLGFDEHEFARLQMLSAARAQP